MDSNEQLPSYMRMSAEEYNLMMDWADMDRKAVSHEAGMLVTDGVALASTVGPRDGNATKEVG